METRMIFLYSIAILVLIIVLICCLTITYEYILKQTHYGIMFYQFLYILFTLGNNKTKYIKEQKQTNEKYVIIKFKEEDKCKCDICDLTYNEITNKIIIDEKEKEFILNDYFMTFKCCKYTKKICKKCFLIYFYTKFNKINRSLFSNFNCIYCTQQVYILQLETEFIKILVNN